MYHQQNPQHYGIVPLRLDAIKTVTGLKREIARVESKIAQQKQFKKSRRTTVAKRAVQRLIDKNNARLKKLKKFLVIKEEKKDAKAQAKLEKELVADYATFDDSLPIETQVAMEEQMVSATGAYQGRSPLQTIILLGVLGISGFFGYRYFQSLND